MCHADVEYIPACAENLRPGARAFDNFFSMHRFAIGLLAVLAACTETPADKAITVCEPLCRCVEALPAAQHECTASCITQFERDPLPQACVACVIEHADRCTTLLDDCDSPCTVFTPLQSYGARNELGIEDL